MSKVVGQHNLIFLLLYYFMLCFHHLY